MKQEKFWTAKPDKGMLGRRNLFAKRSLALIRKHRLKTILDIGCGRSRDPIYFAKNGLDVTAVDVSANRLKSLKKQSAGLDVEVSCQDVRRLKFSHKFDVIYSHLSLHYFDDKTTTLIFDNLHKLLNKGGLLLVKVKSTDDVKYGKGRKISDDMFVEKGHIKHFFTKDYLRERMRKFRILSIRKTQGMYKRKSNFIEAVGKK